MEDAERLEERRALALDADGGLRAVGPVREHRHLHLRRVRIGAEEVGHREELGEAVVPVGVLEAEAVAAEVDVDDAAAEDARALRVVRAEDGDLDLVVLEEEVPHVGHRHGAAHELAAVLDLLGDEHAAAVVAPEEGEEAGAERGEERERSDRPHGSALRQRLSWAWKTSESFFSEVPCSSSRCV